MYEGGVGEEREKGIYANNYIPSLFVTECGTTLEKSMLSAIARALLITFPLERRGG